MLDSETGRALRDQEQELSTTFVEKYGEQLRLHLESQVFAAVCFVLPRGYCGHHNQAMPSSRTGGLDGAILVLAFGSYRVLSRFLDLMKLTKRVAYFHTDLC